MHILKSHPKPVVKQMAPMRLCEVDRHAVYHIRSIHLDRPGTDMLEGLGLSPGRYIEVLYNDFKGTLALIACGRHVILGRQITYKLKVIPSRRPLTHSPPQQHPEHLPAMEEG